MKKFFVTTPIYYVNAKPHIGHVYTSIAADTLARWHRAHGDDVLFATGTDENSQKNVEAAKSAGKPVQEYVDDMARIWEETFQQLGLTHDVFIRTTKPEHVRAVEVMLTAITENGDTIYLGDYEGYYCVGCEAFKAENELIDGKCPVHHQEPKKIKEKNYFFRLTNFRDQLLKHYNDFPDFVQPESARNQMLHYIEHEMEDISISRQSQEWGIRMPQDDNHAVYVWFDALINYLTVAGYPNESFRDRWPADLHLIGKDITKFHCAIWPAMLMAAGLAVPKKIFAHGFFTIDGQKISKSLGNAIDPLELSKEYPFDAIRYYLLRDIPFGNDGDFSHIRLKDRYNADLANGLGNLVSRTLNMIEQYSIVIPDNSHEHLPEEASKKLLPVDAHITDLAFDKALAAIWDAITWADEKIEEKKPWQLAKEEKREELETILQQLYATLNAINEKLESLLPDTYQKLTELLTAQPLKKPTEPLFMRK